jgi:hypothetical protein
MKSKLFFAEPHRCRRIKRFINKDFLMILALLSFHFPIQDKFLVALSAASIQNSAYLFSDEKISYLEKKVITFS